MTAFASRFCRCFSVLCLFLATSIEVGATEPAKTELRFDVVIYGGTASAVTAAVQTKRMGRSVVIVDAVQWLRE